MKLHVLLTILRILENEGVKVDDVDAWDGWDHFQEDEDELEVRFEVWGETLQVREICLECGQIVSCCSCRSILQFP